MEDRLRETMNNILFCSDYVPLTSSQIKQNSVTFLCYRRINGILEENRNIVKEKTKVFQELLTVSLGNGYANNILDLNWDENLILENDFFFFFFKNRGIVLRHRGIEFPNCSKFSS